MLHGLMRRGTWALFLSPLYAGLGLIVIVVALVRLPRLVKRVAAILAPTLPCAHGHPNAVLGRWACLSCGSTYHGWVGQCPICGAGALGFECSRCGVTIALPWEDGCRRRSSG